MPSLRVTLLSPAGEKTHAQNRIVRRIAPRLRPFVRFMVDDREQLPCLALLTVAGLFPTDTVFQYIDEDQSDPARTLAAVDAFAPDLLCVTAISHQGPRARFLLNQLRRPGRHRLLGGMWVSGDPEACRDWADTRITGEAEAVFPRFLAEYAAGRPQALYRGHGDFSLDDSPLPRWDLLPRPEIYDKWPLFCSRGCPHACSFCGVVSVYGQRLRRKSLARIDEEIRRIESFVRRPYLSFADENLGLDREYALALAQLLQKRRLPFEAYVDIAFGEDTELIEAFAAAGCRELAIGLESVVPESLQDEAEFKAGMLPRYLAAVRNIQAAGIAVFGLFILGLDGDGPDVFERVLEFCDESGIANAEFASLSPVPGTPMYERLAREGRLLPLEGQEHRWEKHEYEPKKMSAEALKKGIMRLYARFHSAERTARRRRGLKEILARRLARDQKRNTLSKNR